MKKRLKVGIYNRHWRTMGGGEKYAAGIAEALAPEHDVELLTYYPLSTESLESNLDVDLKGVDIRVVPDISDDRCAESITGAYDLFINSSYMTAMPSFAKRSVLVVFFPASLTNDLSTIQRSGIRLLKPVFSRIKKAGPLTSLPSRLSNMPRSMDFLRSYSKIISISEYSRTWIAKYWGLDSDLLYPPVMDSRQPIPPDPRNRKKRILSVGRFFTGGHSKKQLEMVEAFKKLAGKGSAGWELHLAGGTHTEHGAYVSRIKQEAHGYPIVFHLDTSRKELEELYKTCRLFWHAAGFGEDEEAHPEAQEHFGITTVEAMAHGLVPLVFDGGGQREIVRDGVDGYLWKTLDELAAKTSAVAENRRLWEEMAAKAVKRSDDFSKDVFRERLQTVLRPLLESTD